MFTGVVTFARVPQSGIEDHGYARRIALLRGYCFDQAPELTPICSASRNKSGSMSRVRGAGAGRDFEPSPAWSR
jgi:hypothetical protein